ncbi:DUF190 domain-containing protein [archaeon]|nr:MAG: DUF190 domain-containing protein [archaeon]
MKYDADAILLRIFIGESDEHDGEHLYMHILKMLKEEGIAGATVLRGIAGFGKTSRIHTSSILRLSTDLPLVMEVTDLAENIERIKPRLMKLVQGGLITEERVRIIKYEGDDAPRT